MPKARGAPARGGSKNSKPAARKPPQPRSASKAEAAETPRKLPANYQQREVPFNLQQSLLDVFSHTLAPTLSSPRLNDALQAIKRALFERDFAGAFGGVDDAKEGTVKSADNDNGDKTSAEQIATSSLGTIPPLDAYAARWSPTRALCYASVLGSPAVQRHWNAGQQPEIKQPPPLRMVAIGGGAAEIVAFAALLMSGEPGEDRSGDLVLLDSGPWASVVERLRVSMVTADAGGQNPALIEPAERLRVDIRQLDILQVHDEEMASIVGGTTTTATTLISMFFTLNELFTAGGLGAAATFLLRLTKAASPGTVLLIVDSPGSYAETTIGSQERRYPMRWLLDKFLTQDSGEWSKAHEDEAIWFRLPASLSYPIRLEDMRYQSHLYVRN